MLALSSGKWTWCHFLYLLTKFHCGTCNAFPTYFLTLHSESFFYQRLLEVSILQSLGSVLSEQSWQKECGRADLLDLSLRFLRFCPQYYPCWILNYKAYWCQISLSLFSVGKLSKTRIGDSQQEAKTWQNQQ
jgi:hypothetical protein